MTHTHSHTHSHTHIHTHTLTYTHTQIQIIQWLQDMSKICLNHIILSQLESGITGITTITIIKMTL